MRPAFDRERVFGPPIPGRPKVNDMTAGTLDVFLVIMLSCYAFVGWQRGGITGMLGLVGLILGGMIGFLLAPHIVSLATLTPTHQALTSAFIIIVAALVGQVSVATIGERLRSRQRVRAVRVADSIAGAMVAVVSVAVGVWLVAGAARTLVPERASNAIADSQVLSGLDAAMPSGADRWSASLRNELDRSGFPRVFEQAVEPDVPDAPADPGVARTDAVERASRSIVKIATAPTECGGQYGGSGWVQAPGRVVTNAHVVAGSGPVSVQVRGEGERLRATVVMFDPRADLAVLDVPDLKAPALPMTSTPLRPNTDAVIAGYPGGGPYRVISAKVSTPLQARGHDIYGQPGVDRSVYAVNAPVRPGNSGGPMLTADGRVAGTVFARAKSTGDTGYVLTNQMLTSRLGSVGSSSVPTGACAIR